MTIVEQLQEDIKTAMRAKDRERLTTLRSLMAELKNLVINTGKETTDEIVIGVVAKGIKIRQDSVTTYEDADREDLAIIERAEIEIYKSSTNKYSVSVWVEKEGKSISEKTKINLKNKNINYKLNLPVQLKPNCDGKIKDGNAQLIVEGLDVALISKSELFD